MKIARLGVAPPSPLSCFRGMLSASPQESLSVDGVESVREVNLEHHFVTGVSMPADVLGENLDYSLRPERTSDSNLQWTQVARSFSLVAAHRYLLARLRTVSPTPIGLTSPSSFLRANKEAPAKAGAKAVGTHPATKV